MNRAQRLHEIRSLLQADDVLTDVQLQRQGYSSDGLPSLLLSVRPLVTSRVERTVRFVAAQAQIFRDRPTQLAHYAGIAACRWQIGARREDWTLDRGQGQGQRPDAEWRDPEGRTWAIEYDAGYMKKVVREKMVAFQATYDGVIWATPSQVRSRHLRALYPQARVVTVDYWSAHT